MAVAQTPAAQAEWSRAGQAAGQSAILSISLYTCMPADTAEWGAALQASMSLARPLRTCTRGDNSVGYMCVGAVHSTHARPARESASRECSGGSTCTALTDRASAPCCPRPDCTACRACFVLSPFAWGARPCPVLDCPGACTVLTNLVPPRPPPPCTPVATAGMQISSA